MFFSLSRCSFTVDAWLKTITENKIKFTIKYWIGFGALLTRFRLVISTRRAADVNRIYFFLKTLTNQLTVHRTPYASHKHENCQLDNFDLTFFLFFFLVRLEFHSADAIWLTHKNVCNAHLNTIGFKWRNKNHIHRTWAIFRFIAAQSPL